MKFKDYDPIKPDTLLQNEQPTTLKTGGAAARDGFRWPALTFNNGTVTDRTKREMEAAEAAAAIYRRCGTVRRLVPGGKFKLAKQAGQSIRRTAMSCRSATHHATDDTWINRVRHGVLLQQLHLLPVKVTWRQPLATPRPRMEGIHTAIVLGPEGEEIYTDDLGRVKVRFYWDHRDEADRRTSDAGRA